jgi:hypothetical protein
MAVQVDADHVAGSAPDGDVVAGRQHPAHDGEVAGAPLVPAWLRLPAAG